MPKRISELERIMTELKAFTDVACTVDPGKDKDLVGDMCNDAYLMLEQARRTFGSKEKRGLTRRVPR